MEATALTVIQRAAVALGSSKAETELTALALQSKSITAVTSPDGRTECHAAAMTAKAARIGIEKAAKAARDDATQFSKAVIAEEKRLVALIEPEESRLITMRDAWDSEIAREKAAKAEAERLAILEITTRITNIRAWPMLAIESSSASVLDEIERLEALPIDDSFKAYYGEAAEAKAESLAKLRSIFTAKVRAEEEEIRIKQEQAEQFARIKAEREEIARQREAQEIREAKAKALVDAEMRKLSALQAAAAAEQKAMADEREKISKEEQDRTEREHAAKFAAELLEASRSPVLSDKEVADANAIAFIDRITEYPPEAGQKPASETGTPAGAVSVVLAVSSPKVGPTKLDIIDSLLRRLSDREIDLVLHYCERLLASKKAEAA